MNLLSVAVVVASMMGGQKTAAPAYRQVQVKSAGIELSVPKIWLQNRKESNVVASFKLPIEGSKTSGRLEIGYVIDGSTDVDGFQSAQRELQTQLGNTVERQWKSDVLNAPFAFTKFKKDGEVVVRGVFFRSTEAKLTILLAAAPEQFDKVEPALQKVLESIRDIPIVEEKRAKIAVPKVYQLAPEGFPVSRKRQLAQPVTMNGEQFELLLPKSSKVGKLGESSFTVALPGLTGSTIFSCYQLTNRSTSELLIDKVNESLGLFEGSVKRVDNFRRMTLGENQRFIIVREGKSAKDGKPLLSVDSVLVGVDGGIIHAFYLSNNEKSFAKEIRALKESLEITRIFQKKWSLPLARAQI
jgi:hypothetical protein